MSENHGTVKTEQVFDVTIIERKEVRHEGSGVLKEVLRKTLVDKKLSATSQIIAITKGIALATASNKDLDIDMLETTASPFCS